MKNTNLIHKTDDPEVPYPVCGTDIIEALIEQSSYTFNWTKVNCKNCLKTKEKK